MPELERRLVEAEQAEQQETTLLRDKVAEEEVAEVVSKWTGIPVSKMLEGEREKLLHLEEDLGKRVVGQEEGYDEGGYLTEAVRRRPYSVLLLDEVEKAHPDVFNVLLQVLDDGRLTDGQGHTVDFRNTVIAMTSNLGSDVIQRTAGDERYDEMKRAVMEIVGQHFRPEFINRVDDTVVFHPLQRKQIRRIARLQVDILARRLGIRG